MQQKAGQKAGQMQQKAGQIGEKTGEVANDNKSWATDRVIATQSQVRLTSLRMSP